VEFYKQSHGRLYYIKSINQSNFLFAEILSFRGNCTLLQKETQK